MRNRRVEFEPKSCNIKLHNHLPPPVPSVLFSPAAALAAPSTLPTRTQKGSKRHASHCLVTMTTVLAPPLASHCCDQQHAASKLFCLLPDFGEERAALAQTAECRDHGALPAYGQWVSCSSFECPLQLRIDDVGLMRQLVSVAQNSGETQCLQLLLTIASASLSTNLALSSAWLDAGLFQPLTRAFAADEAVATRKLAFDLAFVIVHSRLHITADSVGNFPPISGLKT
jgi:hypothetical protein